MIFPIVLTVVTVLFLNRTKVGTAMRALADNRDNTALLGVPVRRVEATAWFGSGVIFGFSGLLLATLVSMEIVALTFSIPIAALAAALIGRMDSLVVTLVAAFVIGFVQSRLNAMASLSEYRNMTPFVFAIIVLLWFAWRGAVHGRMAYDGRSPIRHRRRQNARQPGPRRHRPSADVDTRLPSMWSATTVPRVVTLLALLAAALFLIPALLSAFWLQIALTDGHLLRGDARPRHPRRAGGDGVAGTDPGRRRRRVDRAPPAAAVVAPVPDPPGRHRSAHRLRRHVHRLPGAPAARLVPRVDHAHGRGRDHDPAERVQVPQRRRRVLGIRQEHPVGHDRSRAPVDRRRRHRLLPVLRGGRRDPVPRSSRGTSAASPDGRGPRSGRAKSPRSRLASTRPGSSCGASSSRQS